MFIRKGGGSGASTLSALTDTSITSPSNGQILGYNGTTGKWENQAVSGGEAAKKVRYTINSSNWSSTADASGYYTYTITLSSQRFSTDTPINVYQAGSTDTTFPTATEETMYSYVKRAELVNTSSVKLYASTKPTSTFYVYIGADGGSGGTASGVAESVVGTVENGTTASQPYAVGEHFIRNDKFCTAIATIASGATLTQGTNYVEGTIAEAVANKYNYSTTEHVVGKWIDGKTLYEKTFTITSQSADSAEYDVSLFGISNVENAMPVEAVVMGQAISNGFWISANNYLTVIFVASTNKLNVYAPAQRANFPLRVTMRYTKTT